MPVLSARVAPTVPLDLIIDTDPGADDVVALLLAMASPDALKVRAITTVAGNVRLEKTSRNARLAREWGGREDIPVYAGASRPLLRSPVYAANIHGDEGLPGIAVHEPALGLAEGNAVQYLVDTLSAAEPHSITLAVLGPQTNLALALIQSPAIIQGIKEVVVMGGAHLNAGNITPVAEFNLYADAEAAEVVLSSGVKLTYLPLDVTHKVLTSDARLSQLAAVGNQASQLVVDILMEYIKADMQRYGMAGGPVHDASVIAYLIKPELFKGRRVELQVDRRQGATYGQTIVVEYTTPGQPGNVVWIEDADAQGVFDLLSTRLACLK